MNRAITDDPEVLYEMYWSDGMSLSDIADEADCCTKTIHNRFEKFDIETRKSNVEKPPALTHTSTIVGGAYEIWRTYTEDSYYRVRVHRLVAVSEYGFEAVSDSIVHHKNSIPWDNRPSNLEIMTHEEHAAHHAQERLDEHGVAVGDGGSK